MYIIFTPYHYAEYSLRVKDVHKVYCISLHITIYKYSVFYKVFTLETFWPFSSKAWHCIPVIRVTVVMINGENVIIHFYLLIIKICWVWRAFSPWRWQKQSEINIEWSVKRMISIWLCSRQEGLLAWRYLLKLLQ